MDNRSGWIQAIQEMLREGLAVQDAELREDDPHSTARPVRIHRSGKSIVISFNAKLSFATKGEPICIKDRLFPLFREQEGVACMSDYWILCERAQGEEPPVLYVILCELKSGRSQGALAQLENAKLLADYVVRMVGHHRELDPARVRYRGIVFCRKGKPWPWKAGLKPKPLPYAERGRLEIPVVELSDGGEYWLANLCA